MYKLANTAEIYVFVPCKFKSLSSEKLLYLAICNNQISIQL